MIASKNRQSENVLRKMVTLAFPGRELLTSEELTDGLCNAIYKITLDDGEAVVLKIAAKGRRGLLHNEPCLMKTEVEALRIAAECGCAPVPSVLFHSTDTSLCGGEFFFMEFAPGITLGKARNELEREELREYIIKTGALVGSISAVNGTRFGIVGCDDSFDCQHDFLLWMFRNVIGDAEEMSVDFGVPKEEILSRLVAEKLLFDEVDVPHLVHYDIWENNLMIKDGEIVSVLDWERALFGDPLMEDRFRRYSRNPLFFQGVGINTPTESQLRRMLWYDILIFSTMMTEVYYRAYETDEQYHWAKGLFSESWRDLFPEG